MASFASLKGTVPSDGVCLYNEQLMLKGCFELLTDQYKIQNCSENWLAAVEGAHPDPVLYEKKCEDRDWTYYKRSRFLPEMIGKVAFLASVKELFS